MGWQLAALCLLALFYAVYLGKMLSQKRKGIQTDQIGRGKKSAKLLLTEHLMKLATYGVLAVQLVSIFWGTTVFTPAIRMVGLGITLVGDLLFGASVMTMRDNWRAGIPEEKQTELVTGGIYRFSRNPAFLAFDLTYIGSLMAFFNPLLAVFSLFAAVMLHLQILQEEDFMESRFGSAYLEYKQRAGRYWGRR